MSLDISKLENVYDEISSRIRAACPACRELGKDNHRDNLSVWENGAYYCWSYPDDTDHKKRIFELVGIKSEERNLRSIPVTGNRRSLIGTGRTGYFYSREGKFKKGRKINISISHTRKTEKPVPSVPTDEDNEPVMDNSVANLSKQEVREDYLNECDQGRPHSSEERLPDYVALDCEEYGDVLISGMPRSGEATKSQLRQAIHFEERIAAIKRKSAQQ